MAGPMILRARRPRPTWSSSAMSGVSIVHAGVDQPDVRREAFRLRRGRQRRRAHRPLGSAWYAAGRPGRRPSHRLHGSLEGRPGRRLPSCPARPPSCRSASSPTAPAPSAPTWASRPPSRPETFPPRYPAARAPIPTSAPRRPTSSWRGWSTCASRGCRRTRARPTCSSTTPATCPDRLARSVRRRRPDLHEPGRGPDRPVCGDAQLPESPRRRSSSSAGSAGRPPHRGRPPAGGGGRSSLAGGPTRPAAARSSPGSSSRCAPTASPSARP